MGLRINTNVQSLAAQRNLGQVKNSQDNVFQKLSSGQRINKAGDDAAGLAISEKLKADIRSTRQATRNAGDGISMIQTAEGGLNEVSNILVRLRELSVQSASDTVGDTERGFTDLEFQSLVKEVDRIATSTKFNGKDLLSGEGDTLDFQIGIQNNEGNDRISYQPQDSSARVADIGLEGLSVASKEGAQTNLETLDSAISKISGNRANLGALQNRLQSTINNLEVSTENLSAANSRIRDTDVAVETAEMARTNILSNSATSVLAQANQSSQGALRLVG
ncbi:putative flagellin protein [Bacteriovorax sp. BSW11_IV]|uniref:flagellin N-terminal helical domain-containing protein n=1 Tax=Bacteriovorax sp. BSW11_IV TaxID=1353529 RepID=UPI00038A4F93|nr:flagellin [Bacteriovorax sp. BSW11_IV]EQC44848.1 putative flagellin protein [Bacteriovorax sp. BSW11_IV]